MFQIPDPKTVQTIYKITSNRQTNSTRNVEHRMLPKTKEKEEHVAINVTS